MNDRLLILGTSHMGAVKSASADIARTAPAMEVDFYGLPGARFAAARRDATGHFGPNADDAQGQQIARRINGRVAVNLNLYDRILLIGTRFRLFALLRLVKHTQIAEQSERNGVPLISEALFAASVQALVDEAVADMKLQFGDDNRITVAAAAFPAKDVLTPGTHYEKPLASIHGDPRAAQIFADHQVAIDTALTAAGFSYLPQPAETLAAPFLTRSEYLDGATDFRDGSTLIDKRHMNAAYGFSLYQAYAAACLKQTTPPASAGSIEG